MQITAWSKSPFITLLYPVAVRVVFFTGIWLVLTGDDFIASLPFGIPCLAMACWLSMKLRGPQGRDIQIGPLFFYFPYFLYKSVVSGIDVMGRVIDPRLPIDPGFVEFRLSLPKGNPRVFLADIITLLPGTISADLDGEKIIIHALDKSMASQAEIRGLEIKVARLFGVQPDSL